MIYEKYLVIGSIFNASYSHFIVLNLNVGGPCVCNASA